MKVHCVWDLTEKKEKKECVNSQPTVYNELRNFVDIGLVSKL